MGKELVDAQTYSNLTEMWTDLGAEIEDDDV